MNTSNQQQKRGAKRMQIFILTLYMIGSLCFAVGTALSLWQAVRA